MDATAVFWIARAVIILMAAVMFVYMVRGRRSGLMWKRFHLYFLVLGITLLIVGNFVLTMSLTIQPHLSAFYGTYIGAVGVGALIVWLVMKRWLPRHH